MEGKIKRGLEVCSNGSYSTISIGQGIFQTKSNCPSDWIACDLTYANQFFNLSTVKIVSAFSTPITPVRISYLAYTGAAEYAWIPSLTYPFSQRPALS